MRKEEDARPGEATPGGAAPEADVRAAFAALAVGDRFRFTRTFSEADLSLFVGISGDFNPYHTDALFTAATRFGRPILPGLLVAGMVTHIGGLIGFLSREMTFQFLRPVYPGDTVTVETWVSEKDAERRRMVLDAEFRVRDEVVLRGHLVGFPTRVRLRPERDPAP